MYSAIYALCFMTSYRQRGLRVHVSKRPIAMFVYVLLAMGPQRFMTGSSGLVSGCIWILPSQRAADDFDGSKLAGCERPLGDCGTARTPMEEAMSVGTIVMMDGLELGVSGGQRVATKTTTHRATRDSGARCTLRLLPTYDDARIRPPRTCEKVLRLSRTS